MNLKTELNRIKKQVIKLSSDNSFLYQDKAYKRELEFDWNNVAEKWCKLLNN